MHVIQYILIICTNIITSIYHHFNRFHIILPINYHNYNSYIILLCTVYIMYLYKTKLLLFDLSIISCYVMTPNIIKLIYVDNLNHACMSPLESNEVLRVCQMMLIGDVNLRSICKCIYGIVPPSNLTWQMQASGFPFRRNNIWHWLMPVAL